MDEFVMIVLTIGFVGAITTSRWFVCRLCGFSEKGFYRWSAYWPLIMFLTWFISPHGDGLHYMFAPGIAAAFGLAFSLANLRIPSWYSRGLGAVFLLLHSFLLYALFRELEMYNNYFV